MLSLVLDDNLYEIRKPLIWYLGDYLRITRFKLHIICAVISFPGWVPPHQCKGHGDYSSLNESVPMEMGYDGTLQPSTCKIYINGTNYTQTELCPNGWVYKSEYKTIVTEVDIFFCISNKIIVFSNFEALVHLMWSKLLVQILFSQRSENIYNYNI